jgi:GNAT superfamily N-acetyltransferase
VDFTVRDIQVADASAAAQLSAQFGYAVDAAVMQRRIETLDRNLRAVLVACSNGGVIGWIDVCEVHHLQSGAYAEIGGLVVSDTCRSKGIGAQLVAAAERWACDRGLNRMVVRSQVAREAAHRFYLREGYRRTKTSVVFTKEMKQPAG